MFSVPVIAQNSQSVSVQYEQTSQQLELGVSAYKQRNFEQALLHFRAALKTGDLSQQVIAYSNIGRVMLVTGHFEDSIKAFNESIILDNHYALAYANRGVAFEKLKRSKEALQDYNKAISLAPNDATFLSYRADYFFHKYQLSESILDYEKLCAMKPDNSLYFNRLGQLFFETGQFKAALPVLNKSISINPQYVDALINRALVFDELGQIDSSLQDFTVASQLNPKAGGIYGLRAVVLLKRRRLDEAMNDFQTALALQPNSVHVHTGLSRYWLAVDNPDKAREEAEIAKKIDPQFAEAYYLIGESYAQQGKMELALEHHTQAVTINSSHPDYLFAQASSYLRLGRENEAVEVVKKIPTQLTKNTLQAKYQNFWSNYHCRHRRWDEALPFASEAVRLAPFSGSYQFTLAEVLQELGKRPEAETAYQKSCQLGNAEACKRMGVAAH